MSSPPLQWVQGQSIKFTFFRVVDCVLLANIKFTSKRKQKVKIYWANKFNFVIMSFSFILHFPDNKFELKWKISFLYAVTLFCKSPAGP